MDLKGVCKVQRIPIGSSTPNLGQWQAERKAVTEAVASTVIDGRSGQCVGKCEHLQEEIASLMQKLALKGDPSGNTPIDAELAEVLYPWMMAMGTEAARIVHKLDDPSLSRDRRHKLTFDLATSFLHALCIGWAAHKHATTPSLEAGTAAPPPTPGDFEGR